MALESQVKSHQSQLTPKGIDILGPEEVSTCRDSENYHELPLIKQLIILKNISTLSLSHKTFQKDELWTLTLMITNFRHLNGLIQFLINKLT